MESDRLTGPQSAAPSFRRHLQEVLIERCRANPSYSLRAFARSLRVEPSALSQIMNGKRPLTRKMKLRLGTALGMSVEQIASLPADESELPTSQSEPSFQQLSLDAFAVISDWYHYAILELTYVEGFRPDAGWISRRLGITRSEANIAIERLFRLQLLKEVPNGKGPNKTWPHKTWKDASEGGALTHIKPAISSDGARKYQAQLLELSKRALQEVPLSRRNHTSATFCFNAEDLPAAVDRITRFRRQFARQFQPKGAASDVYQIQISFFPLTQPAEKPKKES